jgi:tetratricopeptide (TPR) repeat protein
LKLPEEAESLHKQAAEVLYRIWGTEAEPAKEEQALEVHRLALWGKVEKIAVEIATILSRRWYERSQYREIVKTCEKTLEVFEDYRLFHHLAQAEKGLGCIDEALEHCDRALGFCPPEDEKEKASIINSLAIIYAQQGQVDKAIKYYRQSLEIDHRIGNLQNKAAVLNNIAILCIQQGQVDVGITLLQRVFEVDKRTNYPKDIATTVHNVASLKADWGQFEKAVTLFQISYKLSESNGDVQVQALALHGMATVYADQRQFERANALFQESYELSKSIGYIQGQAVALHGMATICATQEQIKQAIVLLQQSLKLKKRIRDIKGQAMTLWWLGGLAADKQGDFVTALDYLQKSLGILQHLQSPDAEKVRQAIARVQQMRDDIQ